MEEREIVERITRLEERADAVREQLVLSREQMEYRLKGMNEFQKRMDRLEGTFATKNELSKVEKLVWIGIGIVLTIQMVIRLLIK